MLRFRPVESMQSRSADFSECLPGNWGNVSCLNSTLSSAIALATFLALAPTAYAANCSALPNTIANGTTADATQVMANFNSIRDCANNNLAPIAYPTFTGNVNIGSSANGGGVLVVSDSGSTFNQYVSINYGKAGGAYSYFEVIPNANVPLFTWGANLSPYGGVLTLQNPINGPIVIGTNNTERARFDSSGNLYVEVMGTTASAANVFVNTGSSPANQLLRSTSLRKFKRNIKPLGDIDAEFSRIIPVSYYSKASADDPNKPMKGFIADDVAEIDPALATMVQGKPNNIDDRAILAVAVAELKSVKTEVDQLKKEIANLRLGKRPSRSQ